MTSVEAMFHGRLFRVVADHWPAARPRPFGDSREIMMSPRSAYSPRLWLVPDGWESDGLEPVFVVGGGPGEPEARVATPDEPGARLAMLEGLRLMKVAP